MIREGVQIGQVVILIILLYFFVGPYLHQLLDQSLNLPIVTILRQSDITCYQFRHLFFILLSPVLSISVLSLMRIETSFVAFCRVCLGRSFSSYIIYCFLIVYITICGHMESTKSLGIN